MANLSGIITPTNVLTATSTNTVTNKTLTDPKISLGGTNGTSGQAVVSQGSGLAPIWAAVGAEIIRVARTSNTELTSANKGNLIDITSGTFTQTFAAASALGNGWFCYLDNSGTGDITLDPSGSETIDGLTSYIMYPGEVRLVQCDGSVLRSIVINAFYRVFTTTGTWTKPPGYLQIGVDAIGGGSGGSRGQSGGVAGAGGGGGGRMLIEFPASLFATTETVTIGAGGAGATADVTSGIAGGASSVGSVVTATGGTAQINSNFGGAGGAGIADHSPAAAAGFAMGFAGGAPQSQTSGMSAEFGGGSGASKNDFGFNGNPGGSSIFGAGGGGSGAADNEGGTRTGGSGGLTGGIGIGGVGVLGGVGGNGAAGNLRICGQGAAGGGTDGSTGAGFAGGNGGIPGGAGGGGGRGLSTRGNGGAGARGEVRIWGVI